MPQKILIVGPSWVGDMVMAQSLFKLLKQQHPPCEIHVLASAWTLSLLDCMPEVARAIEFPIGHGQLKLMVRYKIAKALQREKYDQAITLPNSFKSALIPWLACIPKRTGWLRECRSLILNDGRKLDKKKYALMVEQYLALGLPATASLPSSCLYPSFVVSAALALNVLKKYKPHLAPKKFILGIAAGAEFGPSKRWPENYFAEVARKQLEKGWEVWLFGSLKDKLVSAKIMELTNGRCEDFTGHTQLAESIALISLISGMVTNDSGLMHVAAALKKPLIAIYGSTSANFTPPLSKEAKILHLNLECQPCFERTCPLKHHQCMRELKPETVCTAIQDWGK